MIDTCPYCCENLEYLGEYGEIMCVKNNSNHTFSMYFISQDLINNVSNPEMYVDYMNCNIIYCRSNKYIRFYYVADKQSVLFISYGNEKPKLEKTFYSINEMIKFSQTIENGSAPECLFL